MSMEISSLDHLVLTVVDVERSIRFYSEILNMEEISFGNERKALRFGRQKINLHPAASPIAPHADQPSPGSADLCFLTETPVTIVARHLQEKGIALIEGPVQRTGAQGPILSIYFRDPDGNLLEVANQQNMDGE